MMILIRIGVWESVKQIEDDPQQRITNCIESFLYLYNRKYSV
jgi:hypothetical protein